MVQPAVSARPHEDTGDKSESTLIPPSAANQEAAASTVPALISDTTVRLSSNPVLPARPVPRSRSVTPLVDDSTAQNNSNSTAYSRPAFAGSKRVAKVTAGARLRQAVLDTRLVRLLLAMALAYALVNKLILHTVLPPLVMLATTQVSCPGLHKHGELAFNLLFGRLDRRYQHDCQHLHRHVSCSTDVLSASNKLCSTAAACINKNVISMVAHADSCSARSFHAWQQASTPGGTQATHA